MSRSTAIVSVFLVGLATAACGSGSNQEQVPQSAAQTPEATGAAAATPSVEITQPMDGDTVQGPQVAVHLVAHGFSVVPAGDATPNSGHFHLFLDRDIGPLDQPIGKEPGHIVHMGDGSSEFTFDSVAPGTHRLIALVGDSIHVPVQPLISDTVTFTVR